MKFHYLCIYIYVRMYDACMYIRNYAYTYVCVDSSTRLSGSAAARTKASRPSPAVRSSTVRAGPTALQSSSSAGDDRLMRNWNFLAAKSIRKGFSLIFARGPHRISKAPS